MKKLIILASAFLLVFGVVGVAGAYTWTDVEDFDPDLYVGWFASQSYTHDLTDVAPIPFTPLEDLIYSYSLSVAVYDDGGWFDSGEVAFINQPGAIGDGLYNFSWTSQTFGWSIAGLIDLNIDGIIGISIDSWYGDFYIASSTLIAEGIDNAPVPEPATMLLLGVGLVGLAGAGRKKLFKK